MRVINTCVLLAVASLLLYKITCLVTKTNAKKINLLKKVTSTRGSDFLVSKPIVYVLIFFFYLNIRGMIPRYKIIDLLVLY